jgi:hypothetical protein
MSYGEPRGREVKPCGSPHDVGEDPSWRPMTQAEEDAEWAEQERERAEALCQLKEDAEAEAAYLKQQGE